MTSAGFPHPPQATPGDPLPGTPPPASPSPATPSASSFSSGSLPPAGGAAQQVGTISAVPGPPEGEARQRLHPLSPLLKGAKSIAVIVAALSWNTLGEVGATDFALIVLAVAVAVVIFSAIGWWNTGYHVVGRELRITEGLIWRRNRAIPLDRLQAVEVRRPLLAQLTGLAELRLEVVGGSKTEAPLAYLTVRDAGALRERLLSLSGKAPAVATPAAAGVREVPLYQVRNQDLLISQLLTPQAFFLPFGVAWVITQFVMEGTWTFIGIASTVTAMAGVLLQPIRRVLRDWDFRLFRGDRLVLHYGLTETRSQVVPPHRVQTVRVTWPLLWRAKQWLHLTLDIAGVSGPEPGDDHASDRLMPVGDVAAARALVAAALPGVDLIGLATSPPPLRAKWLHPFGLRFYGAGLADQVFVSRSGRLTREMTLVPYARLQSVRVVQGPLQRRLGLATVYADTAGGRAGEARDRDLTEAYAIADQLATRSRQARAALAHNPPVSVPPGLGTPGLATPSAVPPGVAGPGGSAAGVVSPGFGGPGVVPPGAVDPPFGETVDETYWQRPEQS
ncbi:PH domain-containing protein [Actinoplanes subglobosus]|uniref:PH domain-containing protein n=1 Tax=Actinoplanes subglobosus TaxID=1547892 RepID=A0ABV8IRH0_9ACTN